MSIMVMNKTKWLVCVIVLVIIRTIESESTAVVLTPNHQAYSFYPLNTSSLSVKIRASQDAHILLTSQPNDVNPVYEIFLGGWKNTKSAIRLNHKRPEKKIAVSPGVLSGTEFRGFWVNWTEGVVAVGKEGEVVPFLEWTNPEPFDVQYYGIRTAWGATGEWIIDNSSVFRAQVDQYDFHIGLPGFVAVNVVAPTTPSLVWKVHNYTFSEGNYDPNGRYHATRAYMESIGNWEARLFIFNVTSEDIAEEMLLTSRVRGQVGSNTYHVNLYASNDSVVSADGATCSTQPSANTTSIPMSSIFTDSINLTDNQLTSVNADLATSKFSIISDVEKELMDCYNYKNISRDDTLTSRGISTSSIIQKTELTTVSIKTGDNSLNASTKAVTSTTPKSVGNSNSTPIMLTSPKRILTTNITKYTTEVPTTRADNNTTKQAKRSSTRTQTFKPPKILTKKTAASPVTRSYLTTIIVKGNPVVVGTNKPSAILTGKTTVDSAKINSWTPIPWAIGFKPTQSKGTPQRQLPCTENGGKTTSHLIIIGILVMVIVVVVAMVSKATYKYKKMTGTWWFKAKFQASIQMDDINDDETNSLIQ